MHAVLDLELAFAAEEWPEDLPLSVHAAAHTGEAELRDADYYGPAVNRAARARGVAHGGQVLLTEGTAALVSDALPPGAGLRDLGLHRLRDLSRPERLFQLTHPGLREHFEPLATSDANVSLPSRSSSFVGRETEVAEVVDALGDARLVTLTGPGGAGKTSLAVAAAAGAAAQYPDGVVFVDLAAVGDSSMVADTVANAFTVRAQPDRTLVDSVAAYLGSRSCLVVLDNCEHVTDGAQLVVDAILRAGPAARVLATSREHLSVAGEVIWLVPPLEGDVATQLFVERARAALPGFDPALQGAAIERLCARVDCMPLAIELAAARVNVLSVDQIVERLDDALRLLGDTDQTAPTRQRTLRATCQWSYDLLSADEQQLFACLSVFAGGFTLDAVEAMASVTPVAVEDVIGYFVRLVDKSLVLRVDGLDPTQPRYRMLEPLRQFARERLVAAGLERAARDQHLAYSTRLVEEVEPHVFRAGARQWLDRLHDEWPNCEAALGWAFATDGGDPDQGARIVAASAWTWFAAGRIAEGTQWAELALRTTAQVPSPRRAGLLYASAAMASVRSDIDTLAARSEELMRIAEEIGSVRFAAIGRDMLGITRWVAGAADESAELHRTAIELYDSAGDSAADGPMYAAICCTELGRSLLAAGRPEEADEALANALRRARALGEDASIGFALDALATRAIATGDVDRATELAEEAVERYRASGYQEGVASGLNTRAGLALARRDTDAAGADYAEAVDVCRRLGHLGGAATALVGLARVAELRGDPLVASERCAAAHGLRTRAGLAPSAAEADELEQLHTRLRTAAGGDAFDDAWARGAAVGLDAVATLVRG